MNLPRDSLKEIVKILATAIARDKPADIDRHEAARLLFYEAWRTATPEQNLVEAITALKNEYEWNEQIKEVLSALELVVTVPF